MYTVEKVAELCFFVLCSNLKLRVQPYILPIVSIMITRGKVTSKFDCLFDIGSRISYFSKRVINKLGCGESALAAVEFEIKIFLCSKDKKKLL